MYPGRSNKPLPITAIVIGIISATMLTFVAYAATLSAAQSAEVSALCLVLYWLEGWISILILMILLLGGLIYATSHLLPAGGSLRQNMQAYGLGMVVGGITGFILVIIAQYALGYLLGLIGAGTTQCPLQMQSTNSATYYTIILNSNPGGGGGSLSASTYIATAGNPVSICANQPINRWQWVGWSGSATLSNQSQMCTGLIMPSANVVETANWWPCVYVYSNSQCSGGNCGSGNSAVQGSATTSYASGGTSGEGIYNCYAEGTAVTLTATPDSASHLCSWTGAGNGGYGVCATPNAYNSCTFKLDYYTSEEATFLPSTQAC